MRTRRTDGIHAGGRPAILETKYQLTRDEMLIKIMQDYKDMTQTELARQYGVSRQTICRYLKLAREGNSETNGKHISTN